MQRLAIAVGIAMLSFAAHAEESTSEIAVLKAQLAQMRDFQSDLLTTVYWSLGVVAAATLALMAFSSFFNLRISAREIDALREEIRAGVSAAQAELSAMFTQLEKRQNDARNSEMIGLRERLSEIVEQRTTIYKYRMNSLEYAFHVFTSEYFKDNNRPWFELRELRKLTENSLEVNREFAVHASLDRMAALVSRGVKPGNTELAEYANFVESIPDNFSISRDKLKKALVEMGS